MAKKVKQEVALQLFPLRYPNTCNECGGEVKHPDGNYIMYTSLYAENADLANAGKGLCPACAGEAYDASIIAPNVPLTPAVVPAATVVYQQVPALAPVAPAPVVKDPDTSAKLLVDDGTPVAPAGGGEYAHTADSIPKSKK